MQETPRRTVLSLDTTSLRETRIIRAVRDGQGTVIGVLVGPDNDYDIIATANELARHLGLYPVGHWRKTGELGKPEFYPTVPGAGHDWLAFLLRLGIDPEEQSAYQALIDA